jgi:hypothetical protein
MLAAASGAEAIHLAPPPLEPNRIVRTADLLHGELLRGPAGQAAADGQAPSSTSSENPYLGQPELRGNGGGEQLKRHRVEAYLATLSAEQLDQLTAREVTAALTDQGMDVSERYVLRLLDEWNARRGSGAPRKGAKR